MTKRVIIVDDHSIVRQGLKGFLEMYPQIEVVGLAENGYEAVEITRRLKPDVVIMDVSMPVMDGIEATRIIKQEIAGVRVIVHTHILQTGDTSKALEAGADACLIKGSDAEILCQVIKGLI